MDEGCSWFSTDCIDTSTDTSNYDQYFCHSSDDDGCNHDYKAPATCFFGTFGSSLPIQWFDNPNQGGFDGDADYCPMRHLITYTVSPPYPDDYYSVCYDLRGADSENGNFGKRFDYGL